MPSVERESMSALALLRFSVVSLDLSLSIHVLRRSVVPGGTQQQQQKETTTTYGGVEFPRLESRG
jgi:hypothetical protein